MIWYQLAISADDNQGVIMRMLRMSDTKETTGHRSHASIYTAIRAGMFTKPVLIGTRSVAWPEHEVNALTAARIAGLSETEIRLLVDRLHAKRATALQEVEA
jgi:prophage regulatory protein